MLKTTRKTVASASKEEAKKMELKVSFDVITRSDMVKHFVETICSASKSDLYKHLRIKYKNLGMVRNIYVLSEVAM